MRRPVNCEHGYRGSANCDSIIAQRVHAIKHAMHTLSGKEPKITPREVGAGQTSDAEHQVRVGAYGFPIETCML